jgi:CRISPR-associated endonuclease/helicase Cas3
MAALWDAPITVTTAVQFFETLAGRDPARLRKLHELPGSGVFVDEEHTAIPAWLWPQTWLWLKELVEEWGCHIVLGSGSLARFWRVKGLVDAEEEVPELLPQGLRNRLLEAERVRVAVRREERRMGLEDLVEFVKEREGPRLVILNTVQNAAVLADRMRAQGEDVVHLSTALAPMHRRKIVDRIRERLKERDDRDWALVATSCVEAGLDFSFRSAVRESCSVASAIQTGGRTNREGEWIGSEVWDVRLSDRVFSSHPGFERSRRVLEEMLEEGELERLTPAEAVTEAVIREVLRQYPKEARELKKLEGRYDFAGVAEMYRVIDADTRTVVVPGEVMRKLEAREHVSSREILMGSVQMWGRKIERLAVQEYRQYPGLYRWNGRYEEDFLGYMADVLPLVYAGELQAYLV